MKLKQVSLSSLILASSLFGTIHGSAPQENCDQKKLKEDNPQLKQKLASMKFQDIKATGEGLLALVSKTDERKLRPLIENYFDQVESLFTEENKKDVFEYIKSVRSHCGKSYKSSQKLFSKLMIIAHLPMYRLLGLEIHLLKAYHL